MLKYSFFVKQTKVMYCLLDLTEVMIYQTHLTTVTDLAAIMQLLYQTDLVIVKSQEEYNGFVV